MLLYDFFTASVSLIGYLGVSILWTLLFSGKQLITFCRKLIYLFVVLIKQYKKLKIKIGTCTT
jgi:hypothetical protein